MHLESSTNLSHLPAKRLTLLNWFRENATPLADAYEGAIRLLEDESFPGRVHFIAHAVRDIADRLVFVLDPHTECTHVQYANKLDEIEKQWPRLQTVSGETTSPVTADSITISHEVASRINTLVEAHRNRRNSPSNYELLFRFLMRNEPSQGEVNRRLASDFKKMRKWFMGRAHLRSEVHSSVDESELQRRFTSFEGMLHSFVGSFYEEITELDEILHQANN